jgi:hypothetical protein
MMTDENKAEGWENVTVRLHPSEVAQLKDLARKRADKIRVNVSMQAVVRGFVIDGLKDAARAR